MTPRPLPNARTLSDAVRAVIASNTADGYRPGRFIQMTANGDAPNLLDVCRTLIYKPELLETLEKDLQRYPMMMTLEDIVQWRGKDWGFDQSTIDNARARSQYFDQLVGRQRYVPM